MRLIFRSLPSRSYNRRELIIIQCGKSNNILNEQNVHGAQSRNQGVFSGKGSKAPQGSMELVLDNGPYPREVLLKDITVFLFTGILESFLKKYN